LAFSSKIPALQARQALQRARFLSMEAAITSCASPHFAIAGQQAGDLNEGDD
jgi:hypothetical protein